MQEVIVSLGVDVSTLTKEAQDSASELNALRMDAERWRIIESHWSAADIKNNRDGSFKSMTITFKASQISDELNKDKLRRAFDGAMMQTHNAKFTGAEEAPTKTTDA